MPSQPTHEILESIEQDDIVQPTPLEVPGAFLRKRKYSEFVTDSDSPPSNPPSKRRSASLGPALILPGVDDFPMLWTDYEAFAAEVVMRVDWDDLARCFNTGYDGAAYCQMAIALFRDRIDELCAEQEDID